ncbi:MAG TPA: TIGR02281 family clan AA aspartic protease [Allosphingosinicella sp.]|jgi:aspartyl protease family protein
MPSAIGPDWQQIALYAAGAVLLLFVLTRLPLVGRLIRVALTLGLTLFCAFLLLQMAPYQPFLSGLAARAGLDRQEVTGREVRIRMAPDGHFWADVSLGKAKRRMLIDSGATMTALSQRTAAAAGIEDAAALVPVVLRTANGLTQARPATLKRLRVGNILASDLKVVISPALGDLDVLGMNFLSRLRAWRVEGRTLILVPHHPQPEARPSPS